MREPAPYPYDAYDPRRQPNVEPPRWPITPQPSALGQAPGYAPERARTPAGYTEPPPNAVAASPEGATVVKRRARRVRRRSLVGDVAAGLFLGDFATDLGLPGAITQVAISFVPLIGSTCAVRDLVADLRRHDHVGAALNVLALTPILGGFSKTFEVIRSTAHVGHAMRVGQHQAQQRKNDHDDRDDRAEQPQPPARRRRR